ncbi:stage V sporulation protein D [Dehalobacter sp. DCM]|uniref:stage V sporulation protein D n=1 Tax=Dehalobacter sp. DCM TaxID=2907827 RepID=UPI00308148BD|nr:stage V sporulation protein D [Dehalobacter sp. DCM]
MIQSLKMRKRIVLLFALCSVFIIVLIIRLGFVQLRDGPFLKNLADDQHYRGVPVAAKRGNIEDSNGNILGMSVSSQTIYAIPAEVRKSGQQEEIAAKLSDILDMKKETVLTKITKRTSIEYVRKKVSAQDAAIITEANLAGIGVVEDSTRFYPNGSLAAHVIGFTGVDSQGLEGIEYSRDEELTGISGSILTEYGANGIQIPDAQHEFLQPVQGNTVRLTIDKNIQAFAERELAKLMAGQGVNMAGKIPKSASILVMEPSSGKVLAIASAPTFDPNNYQASSISTRRNIAIQNGYEPGSTFKIITLAASIEEKVFNPKEMFTDPGYATVLGKKIRCWKSGGHGTQTMVEVVENSCNPGFIMLGQRLGMDKFYHYLTAFGFGQKTGIEMSGEAKGILANKKKATALDLATMSIGQTNNVTPIQLLTAVSAVANGGTLLEPQLVQEITGPDGNVITPFTKKVVRRVVSEDTAKQAREVLESVVTNGTGRRTFLPGYRVAGKTGTAQKVSNGGYIQGEYVASFVGFAPANDPKLAILVVIDGVPFYGGVVAAPVFANVMLDSLKYLGVKPDPNAPLTPGEPLYGVEFPPVKEAAVVPSVLGLTQSDAETTLKKDGFKVKVEGTGTTVIDQIPHGEASVEKGSTVLLYLGSEAGKPTLAPWRELYDPDIEAIAGLGQRIPISSNSELSE